jgi:uncharacterized protein YjbJ (UPF0337 family)
MLCLKYPPILEIVGTKRQNQTKTSSIETKFLRSKTMSLEERAKAAAKNIEGKVQEASGELTGDPADKAAGKAKQAEAQVRNTKEDAKDTVKDVIDKA